MDDAEFDRTPNPFSAFAKTHPRRSRIASSIRLLLTAIVLLVITTAGQSYLQRFRLADLLDGFARRPTASKIERLSELKSFGRDGVPGIVSAITDDEPAVSQSAAEMIAELTTTWTALPSNIQAENQLILAQSLDQASRKIADTADARFARLSELAQSCLETLIESPGGIDTPAYEILMGIVQRSSPPSVLAAQHTIEPAGDAIAETPDEWTNWPPSSERSGSAPTLYRRTVASLPADTTEDVVLSQAANVEPNRVVEPKLLRMQLRPAATLIEQSRAANTSDSTSTAYWVQQLSSNSQFVRMRAVTELGKHGDRDSHQALQDRLGVERNPQVAELIEKQLRR